MGHQQATAAITNDKAFMMNMLSVENAAAEVSVDYDLANAAALSGKTKAAVDFAADPITADWRSLTGSAENADLARRLVGKLLDANLNASDVPIVSTVDTTNPDAAASGSVAYIVDQVIGRDASRARGEDNNKYSPENHGLLKFIAGDVIYVNIKLMQPGVSVGGASSGQRVTASSLQSLYSSASAENYTIRIVLS
jgi:hypothetical protein